MSSSKSKEAKHAARLRREGFDRTYVDRDDGLVTVNCSQCSALVINDIPCHEIGCPNQKRTED